MILDQGVGPILWGAGSSAPAPAFSREFNGTTDEIVTAAGLAPDGTQDLTYLTIWRPLSVKAAGLIAVQDGGGSRVWGSNPYSDGQLYYGASGFTSMPYDVADGWVLDGFTRAAGNFETADNLRKEAAIEPSPRPPGPWQFAHLWA